MLEHTKKRIFLSTTSSYLVALLGTAFHHVLIKTMTMLGFCRRFFCELSRKMFISLQQLERLIAFASTLRSTYFQRFITISYNRQMKAFVF